MPIFARISTEEKLNLAKTFKLLLRSGMPVEVIFETLAKQTRNPSLQKVLREGQERVRKGTPIYEVFAQNPYFGKVFASFIMVGEKSGTLEEALDYLENWLSRQDKLEKEIGAATFYPKIVLSFAILISGGIFYFVFPKLLPIFEVLDVKLPLQTRILLFLANFFKNYGGVFILLVILSIFLFRFLLKLEKVKKFFDKLVLTIPFLKDFFRDYNLTFISYLIYLFYKSGLTILETLQIVEDSLSSYSFKESIKTLREKVITGEPLSEGLNRYPKLYPEIYVKTVATAEQTGGFEEAFSYLGDFFSSQISEKTKRIPLILEPVILLLLGAFVGIIVSGMILPIYKITQGISPASVPR